MTGWADALAGYAREAAGTVSASTLRGRLGRLRRLAGDVGGTPADLTADAFADWAAALPCSDSTRTQYVDAARAFYRWACGRGVVDASPVPHAAPGVRYRLDARWTDAGEAFARAQRAGGIAASTVRRRVQHVRRFAASVGCDPWHVEQDDYLAWMQAQPMSTATTAAVRDSLRAFYRWATAAGRLAADPTVEPEQRRGAGAVRVGPGHRLDVPALWDVQIRAWRRWLIAGGAAHTTVRARVEQVETFARAHAGADPFGLTMDDVYDWMAGHRWARETMRSRRATLRAFYRWACSTGRCDADPTELMPRVRAGDPSRTPATDAEYAAALHAAAGTRWELAVRMAAELGMRRAEVACCHAADLRPEAGGWWLTVHGKGGKVRRLPVADALARRIRQAGDGYVFANRDGGHVTPRHVGKQVSATLPPGVTMHALRHRFATRAYNIDRDVFTVQRLLGHASAATTQRYVQVSDERMRALVEAVAP